MSFLEKVSDGLAAEKQFENKVKRFLESEGIYPLGCPKQDMTIKPCGYWEKRWGGGKFTKAGLPDMHIVVCGISVEIELKAPNGRPSELQKKMIEQIKNSGGIAEIVYPKDFESFKILIKNLKGEEENVNAL